ncbi:unnamed protein product [Brugia pahangi]|uniref:Uncharacterized protein n=1 Tax=Brugia pahangi TaxID=6280 RepID=A0A0N4TY86_BRUPA|nr:unnamed protein product [Brugia pahangi]
MFSSSKVPSNNLCFYLRDNTYKLSSPERQSIDLVSAMNIFECQQKQKFCLSFENSRRMLQWLMQDSSKQGDQKTSTSLQKQIQEIQEKDIPKYNKRDETSSE